MRLGALFFVFASLPALAMVEIGGEFGYDRLKYGARKQNKRVERSYAGSIATYFLSNTALEFNYSYIEQVQTETGINTALDSTISITGRQSTVETQVFGVGLRQAFAGRKSLIRPLVSLGYAKQFITYRNEFNLYDLLTDTNSTVIDDPEKERQDSVFASFMLQIRLSARLALKGSIRTVFPAFETDQAGDNMQYTAGFSWFF